MVPDTTFDLIVIGAGAAGLMAAITAARRDKKVLLLEQLPQIGAKLKATGGGRCNLGNTLSNEVFMERFGREGRFMTTALEAFNHHDLMAFFKSLGVESHAPDGQRIFPVTHNASTIIDAFEKAIDELGITLLCSQKVISVDVIEGKVSGIYTVEKSYKAPCVIIATGGLGYPQLGANGDGFKMASTLGHQITPLYPAMMPLHVKQTWVKNCRADTIAKAEIRINLPKVTVRAIGDLIFTEHGIRGPVVLDFAREITPLLEKYGEVPLLINLLKGLNEEQIRGHLKEEAEKKPDSSMKELLTTLLPSSVAKAFCLLADISESAHFSKLKGVEKDTLIKLLANTPLTVTGHDGFKRAMITRGGVSLKEIEPKTMQSKRVHGLYFCGEVMNLDGPCGGFNLQWSFSSGYLAGVEASK
ncbi:MAG: NAD(P)/FAD-dependent oxidoreductase [Sulfurospirillaceae bacterium]|nr:NAD(P)/FAD-dependent oxidoreductase [Sulfurospirillaceae bacterium]